MDLPVFFRADAMIIKEEVLQDFYNRQLVIDWHEDEELVPYFMQALSNYVPDLTWNDGIPLLDRQLSIHNNNNRLYLNVDLDNGGVFADDEDYIALELDGVPIIPISEAFTDMELPDLTPILSLL